VFSRRALAAETGACTNNIPIHQPTAERPDPQDNDNDFSEPEIEMAFHNHGFNLESLGNPITPIGGHYILSHFDTQYLNANGYSIAIGGLVANPYKVSLQDIMSRQMVNQVVTMECAGIGRRDLSPRPLYVPWGHEDCGTFQWTGTPLAPLLAAAGILNGAVEVVFTGWDHGVDQGIEHAFERSLPIAEAMKPEVMLAWAHNGQPLLPEHGHPLRLIVPSYYGMASVKWLRAVTVIPEPFQGVEQTKAYVYQYQKDGPKIPVTQKRVNSLMLPPGVPDLVTRTRFVPAGTYQIVGKAWSGMGTISAVEFSGDGGGTWQQAQLNPIAPDPYAWVQWTASWKAHKGQYMLLCRATDSGGNVQPIDPNALWNIGGNGVAAVQRVDTIVTSPGEDILAHVPCIPRAVLPGASPPPAPGVSNTAA